MDIRFNANINIEFFLDDGVCNILKETHNITDDIIKENAVNTIQSELEKAIEKIFEDTEYKCDIVILNNIIKNKSEV